MFSCVSRLVCMSSCTQTISDTNHLIYDKSIGIALNLVKISMKNAHVLLWHMQNCFRIVSEVKSVFELLMHICGAKQISTVAIDTPEITIQTPGPHLMSNFDWVICVKLSPDTKNLHC